MATSRNTRNRTSVFAPSILARFAYYGYVRIRYEIVGHRHNYDKIITIFAVFSNLFSLSLLGTRLLIEKRHSPDVATIL